MRRERERGREREREREVPAGGTDNPDIPRRFHSISLPFPSLPFLPSLSEYPGCPPRLPFPHFLPVNRLHLKNPGPWKLEGAVLCSLALPNLSENPIPACDSSFTPEISLTVLLLSAVFPLSGYLRTDHLSLKRPLPFSFHHKTTTPSINFLLHDNFF
ncbi:hypothetical protein EYC84_003493 [Monilinia fructicola]|uniref:Uncharacterized protein n=1 Tax=Monilinia fructicola TaxID=38448 RepID=A0A5M9JWU8_MONFR|nr:hypothetical protein EYC84_003493 [Monilinia fructicola]